MSIAQRIRLVKREKRKAALAEFAGSMKELWEGVDALEYQQGLREERPVG